MDMTPKPLSVPMDATDLALVDALGRGLPLAPRPYQVLGMALGLGEEEVIGRIRRLSDKGVMRRFGAIVRHGELGYRANAMCVFDIPDAEAPDLGARLATRPEVTLCYRRTRRPPEWPYNLYAMVHGRERSEVEGRIARMVSETGLDAYPRAVLFSTRRFKQGGGVYGRPLTEKEGAQ